MMSAVDELLSLPPYGLSPGAKTAALLPAVREELAHHHDHCEPFARWCLRQGFDPRGPWSDLAEVPPLPVNIFKRMLLRSVPETEIVRTLSSSTTSSQTPSRIALDGTTRNRQMRALAAILSHRLGRQRRPFIVLDAPPTPYSSRSARGSLEQPSPPDLEGQMGQEDLSRSERNTRDLSRSERNTDTELSARAAALRGYLMAATRTDYVLRREGESLVLDVEELATAVERAKAEAAAPCLLGYTYVLYRHVVAALIERAVRIDLPPSAVVLHFGGWKRLGDEAVDRQTLTARTAAALGVAEASVCDVYGFTEQLGVVYPDAADGLKRAPTYAEVIVRDPRTLRPVPDGQIGLLEFVCPLAHSYPGVAVLLDDLGRIVSRVPGPDGMTGTAFEVVGRAEQAEIRGCGDTLPRRFYEGIAPVA
jgi:hypothetical protein